MNIVGKLRAIFISQGRVGMENPVSLPDENSYVIFTREEQDGCTVLPRQAIPFQPGKMQSFSQLINPAKSLNQGYLLLRNITGDKTSDLSRLQCNTVFQLRNGNRSLLNFSFSKTLRGTHAPLRICPVFCMVQV